MSVYLIRHAKAGSRHDWEGDDRLRPLSKPGRRQAAAIAERLAGNGVPALFSSPYTRCRQTLEPLGERLGLDVVDEARLAEASRFEEVLELLASVADGTALCSHGDVIPETMAALERRGCTIAGEPDWRKGIVWTLKREGDAAGAPFVSASAWYPSSD